GDDRVRPTTHGGESFLRERSRADHSSWHIARRQRRRKWGARPTVAALCHFTVASARIEVSAFASTSDVARANLLPSTCTSSVSLPGGSPFVSKPPFSSVPAKCG